MNPTTTDTLDTTSLLRILQEFQHPKAKRSKNGESATVPAQQGTRKPINSPSPADDTMPQITTGRYVNIWA